MTTNGPQELSATLLDSIRDGTYPDSEEVISANLGPDALKATIQLLRSSEEELQVSRSTNIRQALLTELDGRPRYDEQFPQTLRTWING